MRRAALHITVNSVCCSKVKGVDVDEDGRIQTLHQRSGEGDDQTDNPVSDTSST